MNNKLKSHTWNMLRNGSASTLEIDMMWTSILNFVIVNIFYPWILELLDPVTGVDTGYMVFMKTYDKFCHNIPEDIMNKCRLVAKIIG